MKTMHFTRLLILILVFVLTIGPAVPAGAGTSSPIGMLSSAGKVEVNGKPVTVPRTLFAGDVVEAEGSARGMLQLAPDGVAQFTASAKAALDRSGETIAVRLERGFVAIRQGTRPVNVLARGGRISPQAGSLVEIAQVRQNTFVTVRKGSAVVSDGGLPAAQTVPEGQTIRVAFLVAPKDDNAAAPDQQKSKAEKKQEKKEKKQKQQKGERRGSQATGAAAGAAAGAAVPSIAVVGVTAAAVAGAAAATAGAVAAATTSPGQRQNIIQNIVSPIRP